MSQADVLPVTIETKRLLLRQWKESDFPAFAQLNADPAVMEFYPRSLSTHESTLLARHLRTLIAERGWGLWAAQSIATKSFLGYVGLHMPAFPLPFAPCIEVGWRLAREHWGQGYATEAAQAALAFGFDKLDLMEIVSFTALSNFRSEAVMRRLGMRRAGEFEHPTLPVDHPLRMHCLYRVAREDYLRNR